MSPTYSVAKALLNRAVQLMAADEAFTQRGISVASTCPGWCRCGRHTARLHAAAAGSADGTWACCAQAPSLVHSLAHNVSPLCRMPATRTDMGTSAADRSAEQGASSVLWPWRHWSADLNGSFTRDGEKQAW